MTAKFSSKRPLTDAEEAEVQDRIASDPDNPELSDAELKKAVPYNTAFPALSETMRKNPGGRPKLDNPKQAVSIRLSASVIEHFKSKGAGWQTRINDALEDIVRKAS